MSQLSEQGDKLQAVESELHKCQQGLALAGRGTSWEGNVQEGGRPNMRFGGMHPQSDIDVMQRLKMQRMPQRQFGVPDGRMYQQANSIHQFTQPPPIRYHRELGQWRVWQQPPQGPHADEFSDNAAQNKLAGQHVKAPDEESHIEDHLSRIQQERQQRAAGMERQLRGENNAEQKDHRVGAAQYDELEHGGDLADNGRLNHPADPNYRGDELANQHQSQEQQLHKVPGEPEGEDLVGDAGLQQQGQDEDRDNEEEGDKNKQQKDKEEVALNAPKVAEQQEKEHKRNDAL